MNFFAPVFYQTVLDGLRKLTGLTYDDDKHPSP
jgi:hypothetical protein